MMIESGVSICIIVERCKEVYLHYAIYGWHWKEGCGRSQPSLSCIERERNDANICCYLYFDKFKKFNDLYYLFTRYMLVYVCLCAFKYSGYFFTFDAITSI